MDIIANGRAVFGPCESMRLAPIAHGVLHWLVLGLAQLSAHGPDGLRIEPLCAAAARTRGSFYHHFQDHDAFIAALLDHWRDWITDGVIEMVELEAEISGKRGRLVPERHYPFEIFGRSRLAARPNFSSASGSGAPVGSHAPSRLRNGCRWLPNASR